MGSPTTRQDPGAQHSPQHQQQQPGSSITVTVRIRPFTDPSSSSTLASSASSSSGPLRILTAVSPTTLLFHPPPSRSYHTLSRRKPITYTFDRIFPEHSTQTTVYENTVQPLLSGVLDGFNATVFAYGATGCGKTYTITGTPDDPGVIFLTMQELFERVRSAEERHRGWEVRCSYFEVYNETIRDLLTTNGSMMMMGKSAGLELREDDAHQRVVVSGLSEHAPRTVEDVMQMLIRGNENRTRAPTEANAVSSRSHAVLQVFMRQTTGEARKSAVLSVIDLAGSERASVTKNKGERLLEGANINRSLLALGNCINALCEGASKSGGGGQLASNQQQQTNVHVPYRDSKLTRLLKYSLSGNCRVVMITNVSASSVYYEETHNTLKYANRAKNIRTTVVQNVEKDGMEELRKELEVLREQLKEATTTTTVNEASQGVADDVFGVLIRRVGKVYEKMVGKEQERIHFTEEVEGCERRVECMKRVMRVLSGLADGNADETGDGGPTATNAMSNITGHINTVLGQLHQTIESLHDMTTTLRHNADQMSVSLHRYTLELDKLARTRTIMRRPLSPYQIERLQMEVQMRKVEMRELALRVRCERLDGAVKEQMGCMEEVLGECVRGICGMSGEGGLEKLVSVIVKRMGKKQEASEEVDVQWDTSTEASESEPEVESESESETETQPNRDEEEVDELEELRLPRFTAPLPPSTPPSKSKRSAEASPITVSTVKKVKNGFRGGPDGSRSVRTCRRTLRRGSTVQDEEDAVDDQPTPVPRSHRSRRDNSNHSSLLAMLGPPPVFDLMNVGNTSPDADEIHSVKKAATPAPAATPRKRRKPRQSLIPVMRKERRESMLPIPKPLPLPGSVAPMMRVRELDNAHDGRVPSPVARRVRRRGGEKAKDMTSDKENASPAARLKSVKMERTHSGSSGGSMSPSSTSPSSGGGVLTRSAARRMGGKPKWK